MSKQALIRGYCFGGIVAAVPLGLFLMFVGMSYNTPPLTVLGVLHVLVADALAYLWQFTDFHP